MKPVTTLNGSIQVITAFLEIELLCERLKLSELEKRYVLHKHLERLSLPSVAKPRQHRKTQAAFNP